MVCAFSLFTHLLQAETYIYLQDMYRVLKKDGILVFTFLEFGLHWDVFEQTVNAQKNNTLPVLNMFIERSVVEIWAEKLEYKVVEIIGGNETMFNGKAMGQSVAILKKNL
jgi:ubiquinone/menaquinone biosynthesis C-methylase UbiE